MRSTILAGLTLISIMVIFSFGGLASMEKGNMTKNMTMPMNMSNMTSPIKMLMNTMTPISMPMSMPMNMPNKMANGSMNMIMLQNVTLNIVLIQNLTEINAIIPASGNETKGNTTGAFNAAKPSAEVHLFKFKV